MTESRNKSYSIPDAVNVADLSEVDRRFESVVAQHFAANSYPSNPWSQPHQPVQPYTIPSTGTNPTAPYAPIPNINDINGPWVQSGIDHAAEIDSLRAEIRDLRAQLAEMEGMDKRMQEMEVLLSLVLQMAGLQVPVLE